MRAFDSKSIVAALWAVQDDSEQLSFALSEQPV
jgi:hypothetical protein